MSSSAVLWLVLLDTPLPEHSRSLALTPITSRKFPNMLPLIIFITITAATAAADCIPSGPASTVNTALQAGGAGTTVQLCPSAVIDVTDAGITFTAEDQELSTQGYPDDPTRATVLISPGSHITSAVLGRWTSGVKVLNVQVNGNRAGAAAAGDGGAGVLAGDALVEMRGGGRPGRRCGGVPCGIRAAGAVCIISGAGRMGIRVGAVS